MKRIVWPLGLLLVLVTSLGATRAVAAPPNLLTNGDFTAGLTAGTPTGWAPFWSR